MCCKDRKSDDRERENIVAIDWSECIGSFGRVKCTAIENGIWNVKMEVSLA